MLMMLYCVQQTVTIMLTARLRSIVVCHTTGSGHLSSQVTMIWIKRIYIYKQINNSIQLRFICKLTKDQKVSIEAKLKERKEIPRLLNFNKLKRPTTDVKHIKIGQIFVR